MNKKFLHAFYSKFYYNFKRIFCLKYFYILQLICNTTPIHKNVQCIESFDRFLLQVKLIQLVWSSYKNKKWSASNCFGLCIHSHQQLHFINSMNNAYMYIYSQSIKTDSLISEWFTKKYLFRNLYKHPV